jgi:hypothetical protein
LLYLFSPFFLSVNKLCDIIHLFTELMNDYNFDSRRLMFHVKSNLMFVVAQCNPLQGKVGIGSGLARKQATDQRYPFHSAQRKAERSLLKA